jgi:osmoprotectant transport system permease protein
MSALLGFLGDFGGALEFIVKERESVSGGVQIGGIPELLGFGYTHLWISVVAVAIALVIAVPIGPRARPQGQGRVPGHLDVEHRPCVPSLALLAFFIAFIGVGPGNVILVLVLLRSRPSSPTPSSASSR